MLRVKGSYCLMIWGKVEQFSGLHQRNIWTC
ncbi:rCG54273, isoform CRA_a [Rattus norvegicus]|uniref:RCG54273, isoform CRA_a n=1 Tax=Rattus norvegicus TaxID=10116 RepID=A6J8Y0_RAT|nr:rCG54273, isoform CRA_a [Rattus norvegicus]EDM08105.1 rCG54273, isoform CRA_a [Rattus norvegicus]